MISRERLDEFKHKLDLIRESTAYYIKMSDQILKEFDNCDQHNFELLELYDKKMADIQGKIVSEQRTQRRFEEEYSDVIEFLQDSE
jgi:hypothetical protein